VCTFLARAGQDMFLKYFISEFRLLNLPYMTKSDDRLAVLDHLVNPLFVQQSSIIECTHHPHPNAPVNLFHMYDVYICDLFGSTTERQSTECRTTERQATGDPNLQCRTIKRQIWQNVECRTLNVERRTSNPDLGP
jgi:hypothetical protein